MNHGDPLGNRPRQGRAATTLESVEEIRARILGGRPPATRREGPPDPPRIPEPPGDDTRPFRPSIRPPIALLRVLDDGDQEGQDLRIRSSPFVIGRSEGDLLIPHDPGISGRHVELSRAFEDGAHRWLLRDLQSTNGTFVRVSHSQLRDDQELLIGGIRLRFSTAVPGASTASTAADRPGATRKWDAPGRPPASVAAMVVLTPGGDGPRLPISGDEAWIGRDPSACSVVLDDPMVSPRHARVARDARGRWTIHNERSLNGLWLRIREIDLIRGGQFQCGEQRFLVRIP
ncbi:FHA domain-containing protein [Tautonia plasticadhaerens]|uniref:FHA domain protein n=1 Tax=Tautonia plasticadhaerens TaxID=2527974 RepID=A0A518GVH3_9BACT|nr:FHA domain-containing protein [Tautonia plasticadhaerens]QDV32586.1 FHA domain protein [Tautonia plasticadhaerens]